MAFLEQLDATEAACSLNPKKALLRSKSGGRKRSEEERQSAGFLLPGQTWSDRTLKNRRYQLIAGAKALYAATGYLIEDLTEYTDPDVVENVLDVLSSGNSDDEFPSAYAESVGKTLKKLARDYVARSADDMNAILGHIREHAIGETGISRRNKARLRQIIGDRQQRLIDLSDILIAEVNSAIDYKRAKCRGKALAKGRTCSTRVTSLPNLRSYISPAARRRGSARTGSRSATSAPDTMNIWIDAPGAKSADAAMKRFFHLLETRLVLNRKIDQFARL